MLEEGLFWLGLLGLVGGIMLGITLLDEDGDDPFLRNVMFSIGVACVMFIYLSRLGEQTPWNAVLFLLSGVVGGAAALLTAAAAHGNQRAALVAGAVAGVILQVMIKVLPRGKFGFTGFEDLAVGIDIGSTLLISLGTYYLLRKWGKAREPWA